MFLLSTVRVPIDKSGASFIWFVLRNRKVHVVQRRRFLVRRTSGARFEGNSVTQQAAKVVQDAPANGEPSKHLSTGSRRFRD